MILHLVVLSLVLMGLVRLVVLAPGLSMLGKGPLLPGPGEGGKTRIDRARMKGQASGAARLAAARVAAKNAASQSNPKFLMAKGVKPLPGIGNMPPRLRG